MTEVLPLSWMPSRPTANTLQLDIKTPSACCAEMPARRPNAAEMLTRLTCLALWRSISAASSLTERTGPLPPDQTDCGDDFGGRK